MVSFPPCKINLGLKVVAKRPDNYHNIETCFYPVLWTDILEVIPADNFSFTTSGRSIPGDTENNLCVKAYQLLKKDFNLPAVAIHLHKIIPTGAGLGGGSADGAHTLRLLNHVFNLGIRTEQLKSYALQLGSDCPFFIEDNPKLGSGRGEILEPVQVNLSGKFIVLVKPDIHVSTAEAYAGIKPQENGVYIKDILEKKPIAGWSELLVNDFEESVFVNYPGIREIKQKLYQAGAYYAAMSGSGSAVFGIFDKPVDLKSQFPQMTYWSQML